MNVKALIVVGILPSVVFSAHLKPENKVVVLKDTVRYTVATGEVQEWRPFRVAAVSKTRFLTLARASRYRPDP